MSDLSLPYSRYEVLYTYIKYTVHCRYVYILYFTLYLMQSKIDHISMIILWPAGGTYCTRYYDRYVTKHDIHICVNDIMVSTKSLFKVYYNDMAHCSTVYPYIFHSDALRISKWPNVLAQQPCSSRSVEINILVDVYNITV